MLYLLNLLAFLAVAGYAVYLFVNLVYTRYLFIKLGKKAEFEPNLKERFNLILINGFGQSKLFKDKKSGLMHLILFYNFFIIQIGLIELIIKDLLKAMNFLLVRRINTSVFCRSGLRSSCCWILYMEFTAVMGKS